MQIGTTTSVNPDTFMQDLFQTLNTVERINHKAKAQESINQTVTEMVTLEGDNTIYTDADSLTVTYHQAGQVIADSG